METLEIPTVVLKAYKSNPENRDACQALKNHLRRHITSVAGMCTDAMLEAGMRAINGFNMTGTKRPEEVIETAISQV
ncbi:MAG: hypothetical protein WC289_02005 [Patescibacteria group bacterium]|jgi:hypothetical protein